MFMHTYICSSFPVYTDRFTKVIKIAQKYFENIDINYVIFVK